MTDFSHCWECFCGKFNVPSAKSCTCGRTKDGELRRRFSGGVDRENKLHGQIISHCAENNWLPFHGSMAHKTFRTEGEPDFVILMPQGRTLLVECKSETGKLSVEQIGVIKWAEKLGHTVHVVCNLDEFLEITQ